MAEKEEILYVTCVDLEKPATAEDRTTSVSANGHIYVFDEFKPIPVPKNVLDLFKRARSITYRNTVDALSGQSSTQKITSTRFAFTEHEKPNNAAEAV